MPTDTAPAVCPVTISQDAEAFNAIGNHPDVLPWISLGGPVRMEYLLDAPGTVGFLGDGCAFVAHQYEFGVYEVHSMALPGTRGVAQAAEAAIAIMFLASPAMELLTRVPEGNVRAEALAKRVGFLPEFQRAASWGEKTTTFYALRYADWLRAHDWPTETGRRFHALLGEDVEHPEDPAHDKAVGVCVEMAVAGQPDKGVLLYNRWARFAGYETIGIINYDPLVIDIKSHVVTLRGDKLEVAKCR